jgi:Zn-dependent M28 family amino/carboxypeptidase
LSKYFSKKKPNYTLVFCAFSGEEIGLKGSTYFVQNAPINLKSINKRNNEA